MLIASFLMVVGAYAFGAEGMALQHAIQANAASWGGGSLEQVSSNGGAAFSGGAASPAVVSAAANQKASLTWAAKPKDEPSSSKPEPPAPISNSNLKLIRAGGIAVAGAGIGMFAYAVLAATSGPIGWAAALTFFGGMAAYWAHNKLHGRDILK